jgi:hypothetical protein
MEQEIIIESLLQGETKQIQWKVCDFCKVDVDVSKWAVHTYKRSHKRAFKKCNISIKINPLDYNINILKNELNDIKLQIDCILNKLSNINNI